MNVDTPIHQGPAIGQQPPKANVPILDIKPSRGWGSLDLHEVWQYRKPLVFFHLARYYRRLSPAGIGASVDDHHPPDKHGRL